MSLVDSYEELRDYERREYELFKAELPVMHKIIGWLVHQSGGRVQIPNTYLAMAGDELLVERLDHKGYIVLRSRDATVR